MRKGFLNLGLASLFVFSILSFLVALDLFKTFDFNLTVKIQDNLPEKVVGVFSTFSLLGSIEIATLILLISIAIYRGLNIFVILIMYAMVGVIEIAGKVIIDHPGPPILFLKTHLPLHFPSNYIPHEFFAYPSGHSARTAFISVILIAVIYLSDRFKTGVKILLIAAIIMIDAIMYLSRVYLGEHWASDVIGGFFLGTGLAFLAIFLSLSKIDKLKTK